MSEPIGKQARSLPLMVAQQLINEIVTNEIGAGDRITETAVAEAHAVSRSTVREALQLVERAGLVRRIPRTGVEVLPINADYLEEVGEVRGVLLGLAARRATKRASPAAKADFFQLIEELSNLASDGDTSPDEFAAKNTQVQEKLIAMAGSHFLDTHFEQMNHLTLWRTVVTKPGTTFRTPERRQESASNWQAIRKAMQRGDEAGAETAARATLSDALRFLRAQVHHAIDK